LKGVIVVDVSPASRPFNPNTSVYKSMEKLKDFEVSNYNNLKDIKNDLMKIAKSDLVERLLEFIVFSSEKDQF